jgi:hypothetical protein
MSSPLDPTPSQLNPDHTLDPVLIEKILIFQNKAKPVPPYELQK